jgi:hypothetical protein
MRLVRNDLDAFASRVRNAASQPKRCNQKAQRQ